MRGEGGTSDLAETGDDVQDTGGEASLLNKLGEHQAGKGGLLGGLEDDAVAGGQRRANLPPKHEQREVPRDDLVRRQVS